MKKINTAVSPAISLQNKKFVPVANSENGEVSDQTVFYFTQENDKVEATYRGGSIMSGNIIGRFTPEGEMELLYHCLTATMELRAGKARVKISNEHGKIKLTMQWQWLNGDRSAGSSEYIEVQS